MNSGQALPVENNIQQQQVYGSAGNNQQPQPQWAQHQQPQPGQSYDPAAKPPNDTYNYNQQGGGAAPQNIYATTGYQQQPMYYQHGQYGGPSYPPSANFRADLFGCFNDCSSCLEGWLCGYCQVAAQYNMVVNNQSDVDWPVCLGAYWLDVCCGGSGLALCLLNMMVRAKIRARYNIQPAGKEVEDCCISCYCRCCATTQQYHELTSRGSWPGGILVAPPVVQGGQMGSGPVHHKQQQAPLLSKQ